jgi:hypothetical protein
MDYESFYCELQAKEKNIKDSIARQKNIFKSISKNSAKGDIKNLSKDIAAMETLISDYMGCLLEFRELAESFDARKYMQSGDFAKQMLSYCERMGVDVRGDFPAYEIFPYKVKIDADNQDVYIDRKKLSCSRPQYLVSDIKQNREKLMKANFNANTFLNEIAEAYDKLSVIKRKEGGSKTRHFELSLKELHRFLAPMQRFRRDYDMQSFAFDLARLYASDVEFTADGRQYRMGPSRLQSQNIRILDKNGNEDWVGTITFYSNEVQNNKA